MKLSLVIYLSQHSTLHWRHLLNTLPAQEEVFIFHAPQVELPEDLPEHWQVASVSNGVQEAWKTGFKKATGDYISFFEFTNIGSTWSLRGDINKHLPKRKNLWRA